MKDKMYLISEDELADLMEKALKCELITRILNGDLVTPNMSSTYWDITEDTLNTALTSYLENSSFNTFKAMAYAEIACHFEEAN